MAKALFGYVNVADTRSQSLAAEVGRLRARVMELEGQLDQACRANEELHRAMNPVLADDLHSELEAAVLLDSPAYT
jgi:hypothetical protein